jgi:hypothetical protein
VLYLAQKTEREEKIKMFEVWFVGGEFGMDTLEATFDTIEAAEAYIIAEVEASDGIVASDEFYIEEV